MKKIKDSKRLYFIPLLARAIESGDQDHAMTMAFDEIQRLGSQPGYEEGFWQFQEFVKSAIFPSGEEPDRKIQPIRDAIYRIISDLAAGTFEGDEKQKETIINVVKNNPRWNEEFERIKIEAQSFLAPDTPIEIEVLKEDQVIGSSTLSTEPSSIIPIFPGRYTVRFSNGRILWEGNLAREDVLWAYAYPETDLPLAAETEDTQQEPVKTISLLNGELVIEVFAGLESGRMTIKSEKRA